MSRKILKLFIFFRKEKEKRLLFYNKSININQYYDFSLFRYNFEFNINFHDTTFKIHT